MHLIKKFTLIQLIRTSKRYPLTIFLFLFYTLNFFTAWTPKLIKVKNKTKQKNFPKTRSVSHRSLKKNPLFIAKNIRNEIKRVDLIETKKIRKETAKGGIFFRATFHSKKKTNDKKNCRMFFKILVSFVYFL